MERSEKFEHVDQDVIQRTGNMYSQLENMMSSLKKEAQALEVMKQKIKEIDKLKTKVTELNQKLEKCDYDKLELQKCCTNSEQFSQQLRNDMQTLNDLYNKERTDHIETKKYINKLNDDCDTLRCEADTNSNNFQELRKKNSFLQSQMTQCQAINEEMAEKSSKQIISLKKELDQREVERLKVSGRMNQLMDEVGQLNASLKTQTADCESLRKTTSSYQERVIFERNRWVMSLEDLSSGEQRHAADKAVAAQVAAVLQAEANRLQGALRVVEAEAAAALQTAAVAQQESGSARAALAELNALLVGMQVQMRLLKERHEEALGAVAGQAAERLLEAERQAQRADRCQAQLSAALGKLDEAGSATQQLRERCTGLEKALRDTSDAREAALGQLKESGERHWAEVQQAAEREAAAEQRLQELHCRLQASEQRLTETVPQAAQQLRQVQAELAAAAETGQSLRAELGKRLDELTAVRGERDGLLSERSDLLRRMEEQEADKARCDAMFKRTIEADRAKMVLEMRGKLGRMKQLEAEKQELLKETSDVIGQMSSLQAELCKVSNGRDECEKAKISLQAQLTEQRLLKERCLEELAEQRGKEQEAAQQAALQEERFREGMVKMEGLVKESKRTAAAQVLELSHRLKAQLDEISHLKAALEESAEGQKAARQETEKVRLEYELLQRGHGDLQQMMGRDLAAVARAGPRVCSAGGPSCGQSQGGSAAGHSAATGAPAAARGAALPSVAAVAAGILSACRLLHTRQHPAHAAVSAATAGGPVGISCGPC